MLGFLLNQQGKCLECGWHFGGEFARLGGGSARFAATDPKREDLHLLFLITFEKKIGNWFFNATFEKLPFGLPWPLPFSSC